MLRLWTYPKISFRFRDTDTWSCPEVQVKIYIVIFGCVKSKISDDIHNGALQQWWTNCTKNWWLALFWLVCWRSSRNSSHSMKNWKTMENQEKSQNTRNTTIDQGRSRVFYTNKKVKPLKNNKTKKTTINIRKPPSENHLFFYTQKNNETIENH